MNVEASTTAGGDGARKAVRDSILTLRKQGKSNTFSGIAIDPETGNTSPCDELWIPFEKVFRRSPEGKEKDFVMDREQLLDEAENLWGSIKT
ncbi:uncharacterized protein ACHE_70828A [Aspergillus chevalieri]|uniref:Uncharacterized protein n=1 Tax=Aspergillus chevalieri TaxID=182096 RepID=A0A7R7ZRD9_ASPCH|nr:uncharacterized protein ACHE_70828A [Aspergillus chevalieri]BCR91985.1 hypothetical protein ACHE_70828A [Aspergillus chevalieri]